MATIVSNPAQTREEDSGIGMAIGLILLAVVLFLLFVYGLPLIRQSTGESQITIPEKVNINLNQVE
ncbi:MAG: hypothetical protein Q8P26_02825 [Candidatus Levybacteria bacterium]|nr:hypothetical protein [Candidatus Levybacteria bacterium]